MADATPLSVMRATVERLRRRSDHGGAQAQALEQTDRVLVAAGRMVALIEAAGVPDDLLTAEERALIDAVTGEDA
ncbi:hypothetical protein HL658_10000 [Azospirillum sp. RWY-5-1]|uniref:Uncharacterized protein n=1 Tax=Azospirillum oleiclasticum TaxID=2735135 RepID=A0ABX2TAK6_9PROT|nr:hypothetical protein [Azospirillum oleiclasticum]NYZ12884.1 hypothetical protein [Azospirillum oleiclasticum]NYZ20044.1 hypothetical protein [Azospirillum oleiclasticum]